MRAVGGGSLVPGQAGRWPRRAGSARRTRTRWSSWVPSGVGTGPRLVRRRLGRSGWGGRSVQLSVRSVGGGSSAALPSGSLNKGPLMPASMLQASAAAFSKRRGPSRTGWVMQPWRKTMSVERDGLRSPPGRSPSCLPSRPIPTAAPVAPRVRCPRTPMASSSYPQGCRSWCLAERQADGGWLRLEVDVVAGHLDGRCGLPGLLQQSGGHRAVTGDLQVQPIRQPVALGFDVL